MEYSDPAVRPLLDLEGLRRVGAPAARSATPSSSGRRRQLASTTTPDVSPPASTVPDPGVGVRRSRRDLGVRPRGAPAARPRARAVGAGRAPRVTGTDPALAVHLAVWARARAPRRCERSDDVVVIVRGTASDDRWHDAARAGDPDEPSARSRADSRWGLAARGALARVRWSRTSLRPRRRTTWCGPTSHPGCTPRRSPASGTRRPRSTGTRPFDLAARGRGRGRAGHDVPHRERAGRARPCRRGSSAGCTPTSARSCSSSRCRWPTRRVTSRCSPGAPDFAVDRWACRARADGRRSRPCSTSPTSPSRCSCSPCSAKVRSSTCSRSSSATRPTR